VIALRGPTKTISVNVRRDRGRDREGVAMALRPRNRMSQRANGDWLRILAPYLRRRDHATTAKFVACPGFAPPLIFRNCVMAFTEAAHIDFQRSVCISSLCSSAGINHACLRARLSFGELVHGRKVCLFRDSGCSSSICFFGHAGAEQPRTSQTVIRSPRTHGFPPRCRARS